MNPSVLPVSAALLFLFGAMPLVAVDGGYSSGLVMMKSGEVMPRGWILEQMRGDLRRGYVGRFGSITPTATVGLFGEQKADYEGPLPPGARETWWSGEVEAHWMDSIIRLAFMTGDRHYQQVARRWVRDILEHQGEDGYIGMYKPQVRFRHQRDNGELWAMSRAMLAMLAYAEFTGDARCVEAVKRAVGLVMAKYPAGSSYFEPGLSGGLTHGMAFVDVLEWLHRLTGDARYVRFAEFLHADYNRHAKRDRDLALDELLDPARVFTGHGAHVAEQFMIPFFLADVTGREEYRKASEIALDKFRFHHCPGGSINSVERVGGKPGSADCLREYCTFKSFTLSLSRVAMITGSPEVADWVEKIVMNSAQGARTHPDLVAAEYCSSDNRVRIDETAHGGRLMYSACHGAAPCCAVSAGQIMPYYVESMWMRRDRDSELVAMQYGPCVLSTRIRGVPLRITETTAYPFSDELTFVMEPGQAVEFTLTLRQPGHVERMEIDGPEGAKISRSDGYLSIRRRWEKGDAVRVRLHCPVRKVPQPASETVQGEHGGLYLQRGALVYALAFPSEFRTLKELGDTGFKNHGVVTKDETGWDYVIGPAAEFTLHGDPEADPLHPWNRPPVRLKGVAADAAGAEVPVTLVPMGCTVLRRVTFPVRRRTPPRAGTNDNGSAHQDRQPRPFPLHSQAERGKVTGTPVGCACGEGVVDWERVARMERRAATSGKSPSSDRERGY